MAGNACLLGKYMYNVYPLAIKGNAVKWKKVQNPA